MTYIEPGSIAVDWRDVAACRQPGLNPEVFFAHGVPGASNRDPWETARSVCAWCPSVEPCLVYALDHDIRDGMFGGLSPDERAAVKARQR